MSFPTYLSTFVGRASERDELTSLIRDRSARLITLTGPGGCGKTRLAFETVGEASRTFEDGASWVNLAELGDSDAVGQKAAMDMQVDVAPGQTSLEALAAYLQHRDSLIVLDNCEHVLAGCVELVDPLLRACPLLTVLATSRQRLGVEGEQVWPLPPLSMPEDESVLPSSLTDYEAVELFQVRAREVNPGFEITESDAPHLTRISRLLDGMPLAIELAASWANVLSAQELSERLVGQLSLLEITDEHRQRSMRETIRWSYDLLTEPEQEVFRALGVFIGGFTLESAEAVFEGKPPKSLSPVEGLRRLVELSMIVTQSAQAGPARYRIPEVIRQYAVERLDTEGESDARRQSHLNYFTRLAERSEAHLFGPDQKFWTARLAADYENIISALSWAIDQPDRETEAAGMVANLFWFWSYTNRLEEGLHWTRRSLDLGGTDRGEALGFRLASNAATLTWLLGDYQSAQDQLREMLAVADKRSSKSGIALSKLPLGIMALHQGRSSEALQLLADAEELFAGLDDRRYWTIALANLAGAHVEAGALEEAQRFAQRSVHLADAGSDVWGLGLALSTLADVTFRRGDTIRALELMDEALEALHESGQRWLIAEAMWRRAEMLRANGDMERAEAEYEACFAMAREAAALQWQIAALSSLGSLMLSRAREAAGHLVGVLTMAPPGEFMEYQCHALLSIARLAAQEGLTAQAVELWGAYRSLTDRFDLPPSADEVGARNQLEPILQSAVHVSHLRAGSELSLEAAARVAFNVAGDIQRREVSTAPRHAVRILGLGPTQVFAGDRSIVASDWTFAKPKELLFYLASNPPKTKEQIGLVFWPDASSRQLRANLRSTLYHLRRALGQREWIVYEDGYYGFNREMDAWFDAVEFETGIEAAEAEQFDSVTEAIDRYERLAQLYRGDFVMDLANDGWAVVRREELKRKQVDLLRRLGGLRTDIGVYDGAVNAYEAALAIDELHEQIHLDLMRCFELQGERTRALSQYQVIEELLDSELGARPSPETTAYYRELQQGIR